MEYEQVEPNTHDNIGVGRTPFYQLREGDYYVYPNQDGTHTTWLYDRGYLCTIDRPHALRISFSGRQFHFSLFGGSDNTLKKDVRSDTCVHDVIQEVEIKMGTGRFKR